MMILYAFLWFLLLAVILGLLLAVCSRYFAVQEDERAVRITEALPGANCGGCGYAGCSACAEAIVKGEAAVGACVAGGQKTADAIAAIMGAEKTEVRKMRAVILCSGTMENAKKKYIYEGAADCHAAMRLGGGPKVCPNGCIGLGSCAAVCSQNAISVKNGVAVVDKEKCLGCGSCIEACPKHIIKLIPYDSKVTVQCSSLDKGPLTRSYCEAGCIGCRLCEKTCAHDAIHVDGFIASVSYDNCIGCGECVEKCPRKIIRTENGKAAVVSSKK